jgi:hypothetical protein
MRVRTTKAHYLGAMLCGLAAFQLSCHKDPNPVAEGFCANDGVVSSRSLGGVGKSDVTAEIVQACGDCQHSVRPGASEGSPCSAPSVCREVCCECPNSFNKTYRARVCEAGHCAGERACSLARSTIRPDACDSSVSTSAP